MTDIFQALAAPFHPDKVSWRVGSTTQDKTKGMALAYIDARDVMERLDAVVGPANWQDRFEFHGPRTVCYLSIRVDGEWVTKADGAGDSDVESEKGAISDAGKRAAVKWGIGRYLYDVPSPWVEIEAAGRSFRIKQNQYPILRKALAEAAGSTQPAPQAAPPRQQTKQQPAGDVDKRLIASGDNPDDYGRSVLALIEGAPDDDLIVRIGRANHNGISRLAKDRPQMHRDIMAAITRAETNLRGQAA